MADKNITKAQVYLNSMFGGHPDWVHLDENGQTGTAVMEGIIRAFQIENGISPVTGTAGPKTLTKMRKLKNITKMDPNDEPLVNVCILQCALFCKGYAAGGITGIYYNSGVAAVKKMQADAGLNASGVVDWKVWTGLLSLNWFSKAQDGDSNVRLIQQQLNADWSNVIGVGPCDGVISRYTAFALIGALQAAEGVTTDFISNINEVNFGPATTKAFPSVLKHGQNGTTYLPFNKLVQYGLYFNGYNPGRFDGIYDSVTTSCVTNFQKDYALDNIGLVTLGEVNVSTMKSLLQSKGDTNRKCFACDTSTILNEQQIIDLKNSGYKCVGRYLTGTVGKAHRDKALTQQEIDLLHSHGLSFFPIYQNGGYEIDYFRYSTRGSIDAKIAIAVSRLLGLPAGTTIYFAVDFDCYGKQISSLIIPYFEKISEVFKSDVNSKNYKVGVYAPRYVCTRLAKAKLTSASFVADMSSGFTSNIGYSIPSNWTFDQFFETQCTSAPSFDIDKVAISGKDVGVTVIESIHSMDSSTLRDETDNTSIEIAQNEYAFNVLSPLGFWDEVAAYGVKHEGEIPITTIDLEKLRIDIAVSFETLLESASQGTRKHLIHVNLDSNGNLTQQCQSEITGISSELKGLGISQCDKIEDSINRIALNIKHGNISYEFTLLSAEQIEVKISVESDDLLPYDSRVDCTQAVNIIYRITIKRPDLTQINTNLAIQEGTVFALIMVLIAIKVLMPIAPVEEIILTILQ